MNFIKPIDEQDGWKLLEQITINDRTLIAYYNPNTEQISIILFHLTDQPNEQSKQSPYTTWGYVTGMVDKLYSCKEAAEVVGLYLKDLKDDNCWWEK